MSGISNVSLNSTNCYFNLSDRKNVSTQENPIPFFKNGKSSGANTTSGKLTTNNKIKVTNPLNKNGSINGVITDIKNDKNGGIVSLTVSNNSTGNQFKYVYDNKEKCYKQENTNKLYKLSENGELVRINKNTEPNPFTSKAAPQKTEAAEDIITDIPIQKFDDKGRLTSEELPNGQRFQYTYRYADSKNPNRKIELDKNGNPDKITCYEYDMNGKLTDLVMRDINGKLLNYERIEYNKNGEVEKHFHNYQFDDHMRILAANIKDGKGSDAGRFQIDYGKYTGDSTSYYYNEKNELVKKEYTDMRGKTIQTEYDKGKLIAESEHQDPYRG